MTNEKFDYLFHLPQVLRVQVNETMRRTERLNFKLCSGMCFAQSFASRNNLKSLKLIQKADGFLGIHVSYGFCHDLPRKHLGYFLTFKENNGKKTIKCTTTKYGRVLWQNEFECLESITMVALIKLRQLMDLHRHSLKILSIKVSREHIMDIDFDFGAHMLSRLEILKVNGKFARQLILKTRKPLITLVLSSPEGTEDLADLPHIYNVKRFLIMPSTRFNIKKLLQIRAANRRVSMMGLSELEIFTFIQRWKHGWMVTSPDRCEWILTGSNFKVEELFRFLEKPINSETLIVQNETSKIAKLYYTEDKLKFELESSI